MEWGLLLSGILAGVIYALSGYFKSVGETWDWLKFIRTVIIGIAVGIVMVTQGVDLEASHTFILGLGATALIDNILKALWRHITNR